MNRYKCRIYDFVYDDIISGKKTIEFRLLNEKFENIQIGDELLFEVLDSDKSILVEVTNKYIYNNVDELSKSKEASSNNIHGYSKEELKKAFLDIYGEKYKIDSKIVGIQFRIKEVHYGI